MAMSVPAPMAMPTSACIRAGASLMPSPTIATRWPWAWRARTCSAFSPGNTWARTLSIPTAEATARAVRSWSPVIITGSSPTALIRAMASRASSLTGSAMATRPTTVGRPPSVATPTSTTVLASACKRSKSARTGVRSAPRSAKKAGLPTKTVCPSKRASTPRPGSARKSCTPARAILRRRAWSTMARPRGCSEAFSTLAASLNTVSSPAPAPLGEGTARTSVTSGLPLVIVPVLSNSTWVTSLKT